jgi:hypothetical protein
LETRFLNRVFDAGRALYLDAHHLSTAGAVRLVVLLRPVFD